MFVMFISHLSFKCEYARTSSALLCASLLKVRSRGRSADAERNYFVVRTRRLAAISLPTSIHKFTRKCQRNMQIRSETKFEFHKSKIATLITKQF